jgi:hypothetical protein
MPTSPRLIIFRAIGFNFFILPIVIYASYTFMCSLPNFKSYLIPNLISENQHFLQFFNGLFMIERKNLFKVLYNYFKLIFLNQNFTVGYRLFYFIKVIRIIFPKFKEN